jgi:hypothetical protein
LPASGSWGQLLVYVTTSPGRWVAAAQADQKKNEESCLAFAGSVTDPAGRA